MVTRSLPLLLTLFFAVSCCGGPKTRAGEVAGDLEIEREIRIQFRETAELRRIMAVCKEGIVTLEGRTTSKEIAEKAVDIAEGVSGVRRVVSKIEIREK